MCLVFFNIYLLSLADKCCSLFFFVFLFFCLWHLAATKFRYFPDYKLGISIRARGESSDLLNTEGEKNDYDWFGSFFFVILFLTLFFSFIRLNYYVFQIFILLV